MASISTSSIQKSFKYDVFISFRGEDTRKSFVGHLYHALQHKSIITYKDEEKITKGNRISDELIGSIEDSRFYIIVFSKDYASSSWCLDELVKIMECQKTSDQRAYPVFYDVEPTEVRKQSGLVGKAFSKLEKDEAAGKWRKALRAAADLAGWELKNTFDGHEAKFIQKIVHEISLELRFIDSSVDEKLVGMENRVKGVVSTLETGSDDVRMIGIKGIGGGGKTTLARAIFDHISRWFEGKSFVENIREVSKASLSGLKELQEQILSDVLEDPGIKISSVHDGKQMMRRVMCGQKVLVVLDDVDNVEQLKALAGEPNWFKAGSRIIITTRDEQVLVAHRVNLIHNVNLLSDEEAICLFSRYTFGKEIPIQGYEELSGNVVRYAAGLPLTITVLGSFFCGKTDLEWIDALERLKTIPLKDTLEKLELSYIGLEADYKEIFLDVACILKGWEKEKAVQVLESCGFHARNGLRVLEQRSLITISGYGSYLGMHDHIEEMGKNIVRRLHPNEPWMCSRLWIPEEIEDILTNDSGNYDAIQCIKWNSISNKTYMRGLRNMKKLRVVDIHGGEGLASQCFPNAVRYLQWDGYRSKSLQKSFQADNLVGLSMPHSKIKRFCKSGERKVLRKLRFLDMRYSDLRTFDLEMTPNIEKLNLACCCHLVELKMPLGCSKLKALYLRYSGLRNLKLAPNPNLKTLDLDGCKYLQKVTMPYQCPKLKVLYLRDLMKLMTLNLPPTLNLEILSLENCYCLEELHMPNGCTNLKSLIIKSSNLSSNLKKINLGRTPDLELLSLAECRYLLELHMPNECPKLKHLNLKNLAFRNLNLGSTPDLEILSLEGCRDLVELHMPNECPKLKHLNLKNPALRNLNLGSTPDLEILNLEGCCDLVELHMPNEFPKLKHLNLKNSALRNLNLGSTPDLEILSLEGCRDLVELHMPNECPKLKRLNLKNSALRNLNLGSTPDLEILSLEGCRDLVELHMPFQCPKLKVLSLEGSELRTLYRVHTPDLETLSLERCCQLSELHMPNECPKLKSPSLSKSQLRSLNLGLTPNLERLNIKECFNLVELRAPIGCLKLVYLDLRDYAGFESFSFYKQIQVPVGSLHVIAESVDTCPMHSDSDLPKFQFSCLYEEPISSSIRNLGKFISTGLSPITDLESFSSSICVLQGLRKLTLEGSIPEVPKDLNRLQSLEELSLLSATIKHLPDSICMLKNLKLLELNSCSFIEKLPEGLGRLECLEKLSLISTTIKHLPDSICMLKNLKLLKLNSCLFIEKLPEGLDRLQSLEELSLISTTIKHLPDSICMLKNLKLLELDSCLFIEKLSEGLDRLQSLEELSLISTKIKHLPDSICMLKNLKHLELNSCLFIEKLPEGLGRLGCLEDLNLTSCIRLQDIPKSICDMKRLKCLNLSSCLQVKKLPRELRRLDCLKGLNIKDTGISDLPDDVFELEGLHIVASDGFSCTVEHL